MFSALTPIEEVKEEGFGGDKREKLGYGSVITNTSADSQGTLKLGKTQSYPNCCEGSGPLYPCK